jgi:hypothetical protein
MGRPQNSDEQALEALERKRTRDREQKQAQRTARKLAVGLAALRASMAGRSWPERQRWYLQVAHFLRQNPMSILALAQELDVKPNTLRQGIRTAEKALVPTIARRPS